jgi:hypothetical protein
MVCFIYLKLAPVNPGFASSFVIQLDKVRSHGNKLSRLDNNFAFQLGKIKRKWKGKSVKNLCGKIIKDI